jgi:hypothetical protein
MESPAGLKPAGQHGVYDFDGNDKKFLQLHHQKSLESLQRPEIDKPTERVYF